MNALEKKLNELEAKLSSGANSGKNSIASQNKNVNSY